MYVYFIYLVQVSKKSTLSYENIISHLAPQVLEHLRLIGSQNEGENERYQFIKTKQILSNYKN